MEAEHKAVGVDLSLAIPFFNEAPNVVSVLEGLIAVLDEAGLVFELLAVDNGSTDETADRIRSVAAVEPRVRHLTVGRNRGYGLGILTGLAEARGAVRGYTWGDGQVAAADLLRIYNALINEAADVAKALRVTREDGAWRRFQSRCYRRVFALLFGPGIDDPNGCPKLFREGALEAIAPRAPDWLLDPEIMAKTLRLGLHTVEVPLNFMKRRKGRSKVNFWTTISFFAGLFRLRARLNRS